MAITSTTKLGLNMYDDGDNPGAGEIDVSAPTNTGLNGNWHKLDTVVGTALESNGTLKANVVTTPSIATDAVTSAKIASNAVTSAKVADGAIVAYKIATSAIEANTMNININGELQVKSSGINTTQLADNAVTAVKITDDAVTATKIASNNTKTKANFVFTKNTASAGFLTIGNVQTSSTVGIPMMRAGSITGMYVTSGTGSAFITVNVGTHLFIAGDKLQVDVSGIQGEGAPPYLVRSFINGTIKATVSDNNIGATTTMIVNVEVEYD